MPVSLLQYLKYSDSLQSGQLLLSWFGQQGDLFVSKWQKTTREPPAKSHERRELWFGETSRLLKRLRVAVRFECRLGCKPTTIHVGCFSCRSNWRSHQALHGSSPETGRLSYGGVLPGLNPLRPVRATVSFVQPFIVVASNNSNVNSGLISTRDVQRFMCHRRRTKPAHETPMGDRAYFTDLYTDSNSISKDKMSGTKTQDFAISPWNDWALAGAALTTGVMPKIVKGSIMLRLAPHSPAPKRRRQMQEDR